MPPCPPLKILSMIESGEVQDTVSGALALAWAKVREHAPRLPGQ